MKKDIKMYLILVVIVILIIAAIIVIKGDGNSDEKTMKCIANKSKIIISPTCTACAYQKQILGTSFGFFEVIDFTEHPEILQQYSISRVPTWIINGQTHAGVQSINKLKQLTGC